MDRSQDGQTSRSLSPIPMGVEAASEAVIKKAILAYLKHCSILCWIQYNGAVWDAKNRGYRRLSFGMRKGVSDILGIFNGKLLAIEVKSKTGRLSPYQKEFLEDVKRHGGIAFVARSVDDVIDNLT